MGYTIALDTETTGVDFHRENGARAFIITISYTDRENPDAWMFPVDPLTRSVSVCEDDIPDIRSIIDNADAVVMQNAGFDVTALHYAGIYDYTQWNWGKTEDTLAAAHVLKSTRAKKLSSIANFYANRRIEAYEEKLGKICNEARALARKYFPDWMIAQEHMEDVPSADSSGKDNKLWKFDMWLPMAIADAMSELGHTSYDDLSHPFRTLTLTYGLADAVCTMLAWPRMESELKRKNRWKYYQSRKMCSMHKVELEFNGVTLSGTKVSEMIRKYASKEQEQNKLCLEIAKTEEVDLKMPKGSGVSNALRDFVFDTLKVKPFSETEGGAPAMDKESMEFWLDTLPVNSAPYQFLKSLSNKRKLSGALQALRGYTRFRVPIEEYNDCVCYKCASELGGRKSCIVCGELQSTNEYYNWHRLHPNYKPYGTRSLRWSSVNPNGQNISSQDDYNLRECFGPAPGREWWAVDAMNLEARLPAYIAGETSLINLYEKPDEPPYYGSTHLMNFEVVFPGIWNKMLEEHGPERIGAEIKDKYGSTYYRRDKNGWFAKQYGAAKKKVDATFGVPGAYEMLDGKYPAITRLNRQCIHQASKQGYITTLPDRTIDPKVGYPLYVPNDEVTTKSLNYYISGSAMWWTWKAQIRTREYIRELNENHNIDAFTTLQVHDELVFDFPKSQHMVNDEPENIVHVRELARLMEIGGDDLGVPTKVSIKYHDTSWAKGVVYPTKVQQSYE